MSLYCTVIAIIVLAAYIPLVLSDYNPYIVSSHSNPSIHAVDDLMSSYVRHNHQDVDQFHSQQFLDASDDDNDDDSPDYQQVNRTHCPNKCSNAGRCLNVTHPTNPKDYTYRCDCGFPSQFEDCHDVTRLPWYYTVFLSAMALFFLFIILYLFQKCNRALETRQSYYTPHQRLKNQGSTMKPDI